jgi:hypothetical protein
VAVEEDVPGSARSIVDRRPRDGHEGRWPREVDPDVDAHPHLRMSRYCDCCHEEHTEQEESFHGVISILGGSDGGVRIEFIE